MPYPFDAKLFNKDRRRGQRDKDVDYPCAGIKEGVFSNLSR